MSPVRPLSASRIVGREQELAAVRSLLADGSGVLLVSGEAGIGKSRLVREAGSHAATLGYDVLNGSCFDGDQAVPYAPFLDLMRGYVTVNPDGARAQLASTAPGFLQLLPELAPRAGSVDVTRDPEQEQRRIFHQMRALLAGLAMERPLLVVVEDIHWSDDTSLELFLLLVRRMPSPRITFMLTYRSDEPSAGLNRFLAEVDRSRGASEVVLRPLMAAETASMLRAILDLPRSPGAAFVHALHDLTGGNPFFVEEVLRSLVAEGAIHPSDDGWQRRRIDQLRVPRSVAEAVQRRVALLSIATRDVLTLAAVVGRRVDLGLLQALTGLDDDALLPAMKELIAAHLLIEVSDELFEFRHALIRQAIYAQLLTRERRALHARVALAIDNWQTGQADGVLETLAYHAFEAGQWERARQLCHAAGDRARALYASQAAAEHYTRALEASTKIDSTADPTLLLSRAQAFDAAGDFSAAHADYEAALGAADVTGDSVTALSSLLQLGLLWSGRDYDEAHTWLLRAVNLARTMDDPTALANALNRLGNWHANHEDIEDALRCHDEALALFEHLGHHRGLAQTLDLVAMARNLAGDLLGAQDAARRAAALFTALDDRQGLAGILILTTLPAAVFELATTVGDSSIREAIAVVERALAMTREIGWRSGEAFMLAVLGESWASAGDFGRALEVLRESIASAEEIDHRQWLVQARWVLGEAYGAMFARERARQELTQALALAQDIHSRFWVRASAAALVSTLAGLGEMDAAEALLTKVPPRDEPMGTLGQRLLWAARADLALAQDQPHEALTIVHRLYATTINLSAEGDVPRLAQLKADALVALGALDEAAALLQMALVTARRDGARPRLYALHDALAAIHRLQGRADLAEAEAATARTIAENLEITIPDGELREGFRYATGLAGGDAAAAGGRGHVAPGGLTPREREVAAQIAAGRANREIAGELYVSERTVETHVANILRKLGLPSRAGIATWATRHDLAPRHVGTDRP